MSEGEDFIPFGEPNPESRRTSDPSQERAIQAPIAARTIVEAGPGFGKTDVACARVVHLLHQGVEPSNILLLSFTRTAVREMRARIRSLANKHPAVSHVEVRTIDSFAGCLCAVLETRPAAGGGHNQTIGHVVENLANPSDEILEYLEPFEHVLIDEAQDLVGCRAQLIARLLGVLPEPCGYTLFLDPAQAIYTWADESGSVSDKEVAFVELVKCLSPAPDHLRLEVLHRTSNPELRRLLLTARGIVLGDGGARASRIRKTLEMMADARSWRVDDFGDALADLGSSCEDALILFRTRAQVLQVSSYLVHAGVPHRLRMGALPSLVAPWIACLVNLTFQETGQMVVRPQDVEGAWNTLSLKHPWLVEGWSLDLAWRTLRKLGAWRRGPEFDLSTVAARIAHRSLPDELVHREIGVRGPVLSTIHGSKGREASRVVFGLTPARGDQDEEEARVYYVGLSRASEELRVHRVSDRGPWGYLPSGRPWRFVRGNRIQVEVGREGDIDPVAGLRAAWVGAERQQEVLASFDGEPVGVRVVTPTATSARTFRNVVLAEHPDGDAPPLAALSKHCLDELKMLVHDRWGYCSPPMKADHLCWRDVTTVAIFEDHPLLSVLPEPFRTTRLWLAPIFTSLGLIYGPRRAGS